MSFIFSFNHNNVVLEDTTSSLGGESLHPVVPGDQQPVLLSLLQVHYTDPPQRLTVSRRFVNPPTFTTWRKSRPVSSRRMAEGDSGELSAFYYPIQDSGSGEVGGTSFLLRQNSGSGKEPRMKVWPQYVESPDREVQERKAGPGQRTAALLLLQKARIDQLKKTSVQSEKSYQTFADKMFNGKNSHHQTKPANLPAYTVPSDYKFKPQQTVFYSTETPEPGAQTDLPSARSFSVYRPQEFGQAQATKKRDLKYQDYFDYISGASPSPAPTPYFQEDFPSDPAEEVQHEEPPRRVREIHFAGFENDSLLSQVGKAAKTRVSKSVRPASTYPKSVGPASTYPKSVGPA